MAVQSAFRFCLVYNSTQSSSTVSSTFTTLNGDVMSGVEMQMGRFGRAQILLDVTASSSPTTLDVWIQKKFHTFNGTAVWSDIGHFAQVGAVSTNQQYAMIENIRAANTGLVHAIENKALAAGTFNNGEWGDEWRAAWTLVGTSYTFSVTVVAHP